MSCKACREVEPGTLAWGDGESCPGFGPSVLLCCAVLRGGVVCCAAVRSAVLHCVVLCCALLCCAVRWVGRTLRPVCGPAGAGQTGGFAVWVAGPGHVVGWRLLGVVFVELLAGSVLQGV